MPNQLIEDITDHLKSLKDKEVICVSLRLRDGYGEEVVDLVGSLEEVIKDLRENSDSLPCEIEEGILWHDESTWSEWLHDEGFSRWVYYKYPEIPTSSLQPNKD